MFAVSYLNDTQEFTTETAAREFARYLAARGIACMVGLVVS